MKDPFKTYYATFIGKKVDLYNQNKQIIRRYNMRADVVNAQVSGYGENAIVSITMNNGKTEIYKSNGQLIRRI